MDLEYMCLNNSSLFVNWLYHIDSISDFQTPFESKIYTLKVTCGEYYPDKPPTARFVSKIKMTCVLDSGMVCIVILRVIMADSGVGMGGISMFYQCSYVPLWFMFNNRSSL
jgi:ubiquitin-protein ligase